MFYKKAPIFLVVFAVFFLISYSAFKKNNIYNQDETESSIELFIDNNETNENVTEGKSQVPTTDGFVETLYQTSRTEKNYRFRNYKLLTSHYEKHGIDMGFSSKESYEAAASAVITNPRAVSKPESDDNDGDMVYFIKSTGEIVFLSSDEYIRTYFIASEDYYNRQ